MLEENLKLSQKVIFAGQGFNLSAGFGVEVGVGNLKKEHSFDLGSSQHKVLVECKSHKWTAGNNVPSAKMTTWNEAMYYFLSSPDDYRKILFVLRDVRQSTGEPLADYYVRTYEHMIPESVEIVEYDSGTNECRNVKKIV